MKYRNLGRSGIQVSEIALGTWITFGGQIDDTQAGLCLREALEQGIQFIDTADAYEIGKAEEVLGALLRDVPRKDYVLATKVYFPTGDGPNDRGLSRKHVMESCEASLKRLGVSYVDLYQCHRYDPKTPVEETVRAMDDLIRQGKILHWGVSMWAGHQITDACRYAERRNADLPITNQPRYNLLDRSIEDEILPVCKRESIGQVVFSPLAQGLLTGKYKQGQVPSGSRASDERSNRFLLPWMTDDTVARVDAFTDLCEEHGIKPAHAAIAFCLRDPGISSVIIGATSPAQVRENAAASDLNASAEFWEAALSIMSPEPDDSGS